MWKAAAVPLRRAGRPVRRVQRGGRERITRGTCAGLFKIPRRRPAGVVAPGFLHRGL